MNFDVAEKYGKAYFMPPEVTYDWVKKDAIEKPPIWCSVDLRDGKEGRLYCYGKMCGCSTHKSQNPTYQYFHNSFF